MGFADLHIHTMYSYNSTASVPAVLKRARQIGLNVIAITDHDEIAGTLEALELAPVYGIEVVPGIEVSTSEGNLLAFFIQKKIEPELTLVDTLIRIGEMGGMAIVPNPASIEHGRHSLSGLSIIKALHHPVASHVLLGIETFNATILNQKTNRYAKVLANRSGIASIGGSDAHELQKIGMGFTEFPGYTTEDLSVAIQNGYTLSCERKKTTFEKITDKIERKILTNHFRASRFHIQNLDTRKQRHIIL